MSRVLLVRLSAIGDIVHTMPTAVAIKRAHPEWTLHWVVRDAYSGVLEGHPAVDELISYRRRPSVGELLSLRKRLRANRYDVALDMQGLLKSAMIVGLSGAKKKLGYHFQREFSNLFSKAVKPAREGLHVVEQYLPVAAALGCEPYPVDFGLKPQPEALERSRLMLDALNLDARPLAINLSAGREWKQWPPAKFAELAQIAKSSGWSPFLIGGPGDGVLEQEFQQTVAAPVPSLVGKTSLAELVGVLSLADAHVGGDTGSTHIAVALSKPVVTMMPRSIGSSSPERTGPYQRREFTVDAEVVADIPVEAVAEKLSAVSGKR